MTASTSMHVLEEAQRLFAAGKPEASDGLLAQVCPADPAYPYALYLRAMMMAAAGNHEQSHALLEEACRLRPESRDMQAALALDVPRKPSPSSPGWRGPATSTP